MDYKVIQKSHTTDESRLDPGAENGCFQTGYYNLNDQSAITQKNLKKKKKKRKGYKQATPLDCSAKCLAA